MLWILYNLILPHLKLFWEQTGRGGQTGGQENILGGKCPPMPSAALQLGFESCTCQFFLFFLSDSLIYCLTSHHSIKFILCSIQKHSRTQAWPTTKQHIIENNRLTVSHTKSKTKENGVVADILKWTFTPKANMKFSNYMCWVGNHLSR